MVRISKSCLIFPQYPVNGSRNSVEDNPTQDFASNRQKHYPSPIVAFCEVSFWDNILKLTEIVILWVMTPSLLASACFGTIGASICNFWNYCVWLRITDEGSVPEMRIWSILLIKSDLKLCIHLSRILFLYSNESNSPILWRCLRIPL